MYSGLPPVGRRSLARPSRCIRLIIDEVFTRLRFCCVGSPAQWDCIDMLAPADHRAENWKWDFPLPPARLIATTPNTELPS